MLMRRKKPLLLTASSHFGSEAAPASDLVYSVGFGLRPNHISDFLNGSVDVGLFEVIADNYMNSYSVDYDNLKSISKKYNLHLHSVSSDVAGFDKLRFGHFQELRRMANETSAFLVSDHLCWNFSNKKNTFELMPFPFRREMIVHITERHKAIEDVLGREFALENISTYFRFKDDEMSEIDFLSELREKSSLRYVLDVNNMFINGFNHSFNPLELISRLDKDAVAAYHLAGHSDVSNFKFDGHDSAIRPEVFKLYEEYVKYFGPRPTIVERDENIPGSIELTAEAHAAMAVMKKVENEVT